MFCYKCGNEIDDEAEICTQCGVRVKELPEPKKKNTFGIWGFVLAGIGFFIPIIFLDLLTSIAGVGLSTVGLLKKDEGKGFAIAGLVIGILGIIAALVLLITEPEFYSELW
ncbi:hypothetical protein EDC18_102264 [Natranaerovirga pectinivora]|uniref:Zinc ribbon protein n=1 Tax=Natranaerovirga pectinivora TaxID=682400 RepID=A0A4V2V0I3_9FIRM|nr:zinc-ribbon domain-containing protein [Natranaerovirga pectinivora]TCT16247.1 hypothetical protein EDC18_102264 [Natranaerovirga pectinivora]